MTVGTPTAASGAPLALVTTSFRRDLDRCRLLCESVDAFVAPDLPHYLLVDERDLALFEPLRGVRRHIVPVERMLPWWVRRVPRSHRWWISLRTLPVRNWILQQIVKLSVSEWVDADAYAFVDSDVAFVRPFDASHVLRDGKVRLFRVPGSGLGLRHKGWHRAAARLLGLAPREYFGSDYIGNIVTWRRDVLRRLQAHLGRGRWGGWRPRLCNTLDFSEYILYGVFTEFVLGADAAGHYADAEDLCHCSWHYALDTEAQAEDFVGRVGPGHRAVLIQSNLGWDAARCRSLYQAVRDRAALLHDLGREAVE